LRRNPKEAEEKRRAVFDRELAVSVMHRTRGIEGGKQGAETEIGPGEGRLPASLAGLTMRLWESCSRLLIRSPTGSRFAGECLIVIHHNPAGRFIDHSTIKELLDFSNTLESGEEIEVEYQKRIITFGRYY